MAKTDWQMDDTVMPSDLNQIGQEINELQADGSTNDDRIGERTIDDTVTPTTNTGKLTTLLNGIAYMIKAITGGANWRTLPGISLAAIKTILDAATDVATANTLIKRDASGRAKVAAPVESDDIARKAEIDEVKQDGSEWKSAVAGAITAAGVPTAATDNRQTFVKHIGDLILRPGINWTIRSTPDDNHWKSVTYGNRLFVAVAITGTGNRVMTSPDGINWTLRSTPADNSWQSVTYGNGLFVAVASSGTGNRVMTSPDGINWTLRSTPVNNFWQTVTYGNGLFVALASSDMINQVMTSLEGINWTLRTSAADNIWNSVTYGNGLFVAVAGTGTGNLVMTSGID